MSNVKKEFKTGEIIMSQGETGTSAFIIEKGRVEILLQTSGKDQISIGTRGVGTIIGEMALFDDAPRTATIKALEDCELLEITKKFLLSFFENLPEPSAKLSTTLNDALLSWSLVVRSN